MGLIRVPIWAWALLVVVLWGAYGHWQHGRLEKARAEAAVEAQRMAARVEAARQERARKASDEYAKKVAQASAATRAVRADNVRLQQLVAQAANTPRDAVTVCGVDGARGRELESLLAEGGDLAAEGAQEVSRLAAKVSGLQEYVSRVCLGDKNASGRN